MIFPVIGVLLLAMAAYAAFHIKELLGLTPLSRNNRLTWILGLVFSFGMFALALGTRGAVIAWGFYTFLLWVVADALRVAFLLFAKVSALRQLYLRVYAKGATAVILALLICIGGYINAKTRHVSEYTVQIQTPSANAAPLTIALLTDIHLGDGLFEKDVEQIVQETNALAPDIVLLGGDIFVETSTPAQIDAALASFSNFQTTLGVYFVPGNHEYYADRSVFFLDALLPRLIDANIIPLRDDVLLIDNRFYLIGREEHSVPRAAIETLMQGLDSCYPTIVLSHQPAGARQAAAAGIDLYLSGHTHAGQLFPAGVLSDWFNINEFNHGLYHIGDFSVIVNAGTGTWGFPVRVGSACEIVLVHISSI